MGTTTSYKRTLPNITQLRAYTGAVSIGMIIEIPSGTHKGSYLWNSTSTAADDNSTVIKLTSRDPGRFIKYDAATLTAGSGSGDMLAANNLSDVASTSTARANLGLGNVNNTADLDKPISNATAIALSSKQPTLVSGTNIKTVNGNSVLGPGNIVITGGNISVAGMATVTTVADLRALPIPAVDGTAVSVSSHGLLSDGGGGIYLWNAAETRADDNGAIIKPNSVGSGSPGRYIHQITDGIVNLRWWGIKSHIQYPGVSGYDINQSIANQFDAAVAFIQSLSYKVKLYIPGDITGQNSAYWVHRTLEVPTSITIIGDGTINNPQTTLIFNPRQVSMKIVGPTVGCFNMKDIKIVQYWHENNFGDRQGHGLVAKTILFLENVHIENCTGVGLHLTGCLIPNDPLYGNTDFSRFDNVRVAYNDHGVYIDGCDANKMVFNQLDCTGNRKWGVYDSGMLGNTYVAPHFAFNGSGTTHEVVVTYGGKLYVAQNRPLDPTVNLNKQPDLFPALWKEYPSGTIYGEPWLSTKQYFSGGPLLVDDDNAWVTIIDPYTEGYQPNMVLNSRSFALNGTPGVGIDNGCWMRMIFGRLFISSDMMLAPGSRSGFGVPADEALAPIHAYHNIAAGVSEAALFEGGTNVTWVKFTNNGGVNTGFLNLADGDMRIYPHTGGGIGVGSNVFYPTQTSGLMSLGSATNKFSKVHADGVVESGAGDPTTVTLPAGQTRVHTNTSTNRTYLYANVGGVIKKTELL